MDLRQIAEELQPQSIATKDWVFQVLRTAIMRGILPGGMPLKQDEISAALGVSHIPVREAFRQLEAQGLVRIYPNRGSVVTQLTLQEMEDIMDVRCMLEVSALRRSIPLMTEDTYQHTETLIQMAEREKDANQLERLNLQFHFALYEPLHNAKLMQLVDQMHANVDRYCRAYYEDPIHHEVSSKQHQTLLQACRAKDVERACHILEEHLEATKTLLEPKLS